jgi:hypothetical protein
VSVISEVPRCGSPHQGMGEKQPDIMVYHLCNLTYEETKIIDANLSEQEFEKYKI